MTLSYRVIFIKIKLCTSNHLLSYTHNPSLSFNYIIAKFFNYKINNKIEKILKQNLYFF